MDDEGTLRRSGIDFSAKSGQCRAAFGLLRLLNLRHNQLRQTNKQKVWTLQGGLWPFVSSKLASQLILPLKGALC